MFPAKQPRVAFTVLCGIWSIYTVDAHLWCLSTSIYVYKYFSMVCKQVSTRRI